MRAHEKEQRERMYGKSGNLFSLFSQPAKKCGEPFAEGGGEQKKALRRDVRAEEKRLSIGRKKRKKEKRRMEKGLVGWFSEMGKGGVAGRYIFLLRTTWEVERGREILHMVQDERVLKPKAFLLSSPTPFSLT